jgi:hypothetical protein
MYPYERRGACRQVYRCPLPAGHSTSTVLVALGSVIRGSPRVNADSEILSGPAMVNWGGGVAGPLTSWLSRAVERSAMTANVFRAETGILEYSTLLVIIPDPSHNHRSNKTSACFQVYATLGCQNSGPWCDLELKISQMNRCANCSQLRAGGDYRADHIKVISMNERRPSDKTISELFSADGYFTTEYVLSVSR